MDETRKYQSTIVELIEDDGPDRIEIAVAERLEAIVEELAELNKGLRFLAMGAALDKVAKNPEILRELLGAAGGKAPPSDSPPSKP